MRRSAIRTDSAPKPKGSYSQAMRVGDLVFTSGFGPHDPQTGEVVGADVGAQTEQTMRNVDAALRAAGSSLASAVKITVHLADLGDFAAFDAVYRSRLTEPYPVRTTVGSTLAGILVEIDAVAVVEQAD
ncbi:MAG TPA: Rid family detoxifying hydrolase [Jatrophihabitans sp.]|nr:Rid family detoxifying hydrolase [Jatrophihabitans sp.]